MGEVAMALQNISKSRLDIGFVYQKLMKIEGFEEELVDSAFDHLQCENLTKGFIANNDKLWRIWLQKFKESN